MNIHGAGERNFLESFPVCNSPLRSFGLGRIAGSLLSYTTNIPTMKIHLLIATCLAAFALPAFADDDETELGKKMDSFNDHYKSIRREKDPAKGVVSAREAQKLVAASLLMTPALVEGMKDGPAKENAMAMFRQMMGESFVILCKIEQAYLAKDLDAVAKLYDSLKELKKNGHEKFTDD